MREAGTFSEGRKGHIPRARTPLARPDQDVVVVRQSSASFHWAKNGEEGREDVRLEFLLRSERAGIKRRCGLRPQGSFLEGRLRYRADSSAFF